MASLVAKVWVMFCLYAGALALHMALPGSPDPLGDGLAITGASFVFLCLGLLFAGAAVLLLSPSGPISLKNIRTLRFAWRDVDFNEILFAAFLILSFCNQAFFAPDHMMGPLTIAVEQAAWFAVPGQRAFSLLVHSCTMDGGRIFTSAFAWVLALIWFGTALTRLGISARLIRAARRQTPDATAGLVSGVLLAVAAAAGIQFLYAGSGFAYLPCSLTAGIAGGLLAGFAPLMLAYILIAALSGVIAGGEEV